MSLCIAENNFLQLKDLLVAFDFMMKKVYYGINYAYEICSGGEVILELEETLYSYTLI